MFPRVAKLAIREIVPVAVVDLVLESEYYSTVTQAHSMISESSSSASLYFPA